MSRIVLAGTLVRFPLGGLNQAVLAWLEGLHRLGHETYFVERVTWPTSCYDVPRGEMTDDCSYGIGVVQSLLARYGLQDRWGFVDGEGRVYGLRRERLAEVFRTADAFLDLEWDEWTTEAATAGVRVVIDGEPGWLQMKLENSVRDGAALPSYDYYYTTGHNLGTPQCTAPTVGKTWGKIFCPIMVDAIPYEPHAGDGPFSTVMKWQSNRPVTFEGQTYGQKDLEFPKFLSLPQLTRAPLELAVSGGVPQAIKAQITEAGWRLRNADEVSLSVDSYRDYIRGSRGEFGVCKQVFVATRSGVFPERPGCYMASGRPAIIQDTGFSEHLPCGRGLFAVRTVEEAAAAIDAVLAAPDLHARAAREIAVEYMESTKVLRRLLGEIGVM